MAFRDVWRNMTQGFIGRLSTNKSAALGAYSSIGKAVPAHSKSLSTWIRPERAETGFPLRLELRGKIIYRTHEDELELIER